MIGVFCFNCWALLGGFFRSIEKLRGCLNRVYLIELCRGPSPKGMRKKKMLDVFVEIDAM